MIGHLVVRSLMKLFVKPASFTSTLYLPREQNAIIVRKNLPEIFIIEKLV